MKKSSTLLLAFLLVSMYASSLPTDGYVSTKSPTSGEMIRSNLYVVRADGTAILLDGDLIQYDPYYSNAVDGMDARKMSNFSENLGMLRESTTLVIERRQTIESRDSIFYKMWNVHHESYQLEFIASNLDHPGLTGYLEDSYLHTKTPINLNGSNYIKFNVTSDAASGAMYRFRMIFTTMVGTVLPLTFNTVKSFLENSEVTVEWQTTNENNITNYAVEKSVDGKSFTKLGDREANNIPVNAYSYIDPYPVNGDNYYRISSTDINGVSTYSQVLKVFKAIEMSTIKVFPNPIIDNTINLRVENQPAGVYKIKLVNSSGQSVFTKEIQLRGGSSTESFRPAQHVPPGIYHLEIIKPGGAKTSLSLIY
ncbi:MAG: T9SS type A sorting domain-containing protein [Ginsengibacter sp.]